MSAPIIGYRYFVDEARRPIYEDAQGSQYVLNDDGERVYGLYFFEEEETCDVPVIADGPSHVVR
jgi:hypothetical protein